MSRVQTHALYSGDFSAIEARVLNWLAGEKDILDMFRAMDAGDKTVHPYKAMAVRMGRGKTLADIKKPSEDYQAGKAAELGAGFGMGAKKFVDAAWAVYQVRVTAEQAEQAIAAYRASHPNVESFWYEVGNAAIRAVEHPGEKIRVGALKSITIACLGKYMYIVLPTKRALVYPAPGIVMEPPPWGGEDRKSLYYSGLSLNNQWVRMRTYGGHLVENIVQAVARDFMVDAKFRAREAGYAPLLSVHDEVVAERPLGEGSLEEYIRLMAVVPDWATGCPVAVEAWTGFRYRK